MTFSLTCLDRLKIADRRAGLTEPSGLALTPGGKGLWTVSDDTERVFRLTLKGKLLPGRSFPVPARGLEGIASHPDGKRLFAVREEDNEILELDIGARAVTARQRLADIAGYDRIAALMAGGGANKGLEGITWNAETGTLFCLKEGAPGVLIEVTADLAAITGHVVLGAHNGFVDPDLGDGEIDFSDLCHDPTRGAFWIVSDKARRLYLYNAAADRVLHSAPLGYARKRTFREIRKAEGVAVDTASQRLYVASDEEARLYVYDVRA